MSTSLKVCTYWTYDCKAVTHIYLRNYSLIFLASPGPKLTKANGTSNCSCGQLYYFQLIGYWLGWPQFISWVHNNKKNLMNSRLLFSARWHEKEFLNKEISQLVHLSNLCSIFDIVQCLEFTNEGIFWYIIDIYLLLACLTMYRQTLYAW